jgi:NAD+ synthase (glutamine-hydrolysing)
MINEMGIMLAESKPFAAEEIIIADIDTSHITHDRIKTTNFPNESIIAPTKTAIKKRQTNLIRIIGPAPFVPSNETTKSERLNSILQIQSTGLAMRLRQTGINKVVLGLSGGLDSTLALMVAIKSARILGLKPLELIHTLTMPGDASSDRTQNNAAKLAESLNIVNEEIPISKLSKKQLEAIGHTDKQDITYENTQARIRQALVFNKANQIHGLALGTGDMSEIALGWCTYNGDHMSHYNVNTSIPKTLVRSLVDFASLNLNPKARKIVLDIIDTPISPELLGNQKTEDIIGPYELHDFFLYHFVRWMEPIEKIRYLAKTAFKNSYADQQIDKWLNVFVDRFYKNQWKRQAMPDGAKVGISLSPKGDWRMPPEASLPKLDFNSKLNV